MSVPICRYLCDSEKFTGVNPHDRYFLLFLAFNAEEDGTFRYPATKLIAMLGGVSRGSFYKQVARLEEMGYLTRQNGTLSLSARLVADSDRGCRQERLSSSPTPPLTLDKTINHVYSKDPPIVPPTATDAPKGDGYAYPQTGMGVNPNVTVVAATPQQTWWERHVSMKSFSERLAEEKARFNANKPEYTKEQEAFLEVYPKAPYDPVAFVLAWEQAVKQDVLPRELIDAARIASNSPAFKEKEGQFIPRPERWLVAKNWAPIVEPWKAERKRRQQEREAQEFERKLMMEAYNE